MRLADFEAMVRRMAEEVPEEYLEGVAEIAVLRATLPHPTRAEIYTLGECIPLPAADGDPDAIQSRVVLYHGSFQALAHLDPEFDWREEAWETLTHELRHHLEWRARAAALEALDRAAEANFARQDGDPFDPHFYQDGDQVAPGVYRVEDDFFVEVVVREVTASVDVGWHGHRWRIRLPEGVTLPAFLTVTEIDDPPPGALVVVVRRAARWRDLFRKVPPAFQAEVPAEPVDSAAPD